MVEKYGPSPAICGGSRKSGRCISRSNLTTRLLPFSSNDMRKWSKPFMVKGLGQYEALSVTSSSKPAGAGVCMMLGAVFRRTRVGRRDPWPLRWTEIFTCRFQVPQSEKHCAPCSLGWALYPTQWFCPLMLLRLEPGGLLNMWVQVGVRLPFRLGQPAGHYRPALTSFIRSPGVGKG